MTYEETLAGIGLTEKQIQQVQLENTRFLAASGAYINSLEDFDSLMAYAMSEGFSL